jgi:hypothetical protein
MIVFEGFAESLSREDYFDSQLVVIGETEKYDSIKRHRIALLKDSLNRVPHSGIKQ